MKFKLIAATLLLALAAVVAIMYLRKQDGRESRADFLSIRVERGNLEISILATGIVQPRTRVEIKPALAGRVEEIRVEEGRTVRRGEILALLSSVERAALLDAARAKGPDELAHWEQIYKPIPLVAPLDGVVIARNVEPGQTVSAQDAVLVMSDRLVVLAQVDETDIGQVHVGQEADIVLDAYTTDHLQARVSHIAYEARTVNNVTIYEVDLTPRLVPPFMRSGMTANVTLKVQSLKGVLVLPVEAIRQVDGHATVSMPSPSGKVPIARPVETGANDGKKVEVLGGLQEGDTVMVKNFHVPRSSEVKSSPFMPWGARKRDSKERSR